MEKSKKPKISTHSQEHIIKEAAMPYGHKSAPLVKDFTWKDFKKIADKVSLSQQEWSDLLHISERTLQRYAKTNGIFSFGVSDRILQIEKVFKKGISVFGSAEAFMEWLRNGSSALEGKISLGSLSGFDGIQRTLTQLGRIEQGLFA